MRVTARGFTLIELVIVMLILSVIAGIGGRLWIGMEKVNRMAKTNLDQSTQGDLALEHLRTDIESSIQVRNDDGALL
ncbi:type II secretion system GspH family protein, partial [bacterium]|nr:type II secretion system GspH family protein [bacterium]